MGQAEEPFEPSPFCRPVAGIRTSSGKAVTSSRTGWHSVAVIRKSLAWDSPQAAARRKIVGCAALEENCLSGSRLDRLGKDRFLRCVTDRFDTLQNEFDDRVGDDLQKSVDRLLGIGL